MDNTESLYFLTGKPNTPVRYHRFSTFQFSRPYRKKNYKKNNIDQASQAAPLFLQENKKNGISAEAKIMSEIPYILQMVDQFRLIWKILPSSNGCKLIENGHWNVNLRKYLYFQHF